MSKNNSLHWELDDEGMLAVSVKGNMPDFFEGKKEAPWHEVRNQIKSLIFKEGILSIGAEAFKGCKALAYVEIPESLELIRYGAFEGCTSLKAVDFPERRVLKHRQSPNQEVRISEKKITMERRSFLFTPWAKKRFGDFITEGGLLIEYYGEDKNVTIPEGIETIDAFVFRKHPIEEVHFPESLRVIGSCAFESTKLKNVMLPDGLEEVRMGAFANIPTLAWVYFMNPDTEIHITAFKDSIEGLTISGHNPSTARTYCLHKGIIFQTNHKVMERFRRIPEKNGEPDVDYFLKRLDRGFVILGIMVNEKTKTVEMVKSQVIKHLPISDFFGTKRWRMLLEYALYPSYDPLQAYRWKYTVRKKYTRPFYPTAGEAFYQQNAAGEKSLEDCRYEWYLSWERNKWSESLEITFLADWLSKNPAYHPAG